MGKLLRTRTCPTHKMQGWAQTIHGRIISPQIIYDQSNSRIPPFSASLFYRKKIGPKPNLPKPYRSVVWTVHFVWTSLVRYTVDGAACNNVVCRFSSVSKSHSTFDQCSSRLESSMDDRRLHVPAWICLYRGRNDPDNRLQQRNMAQPTSRLPRYKHFTYETRNSAIAKGPRNALRQLKSCHLLHSCTKKIHSGRHSVSKQTPNLPGIVFLLAN